MGQHLPFKSGLVLSAAISLFAFGRTAQAQIQVTALGTLGGTFSEPTAINNNGVVVGYSTTSGGATNAFSYSGGTMTNLLPTSAWSAAFGLNDQGQIVGSADFTNGANSHAFVDTSGTVSDLSSVLDGSSPGSSGDSAAIGINSSGVIVGGYIGNVNLNKSVVGETPLFVADSNGVGFVLSGSTVTPIPEFPGTLNPGKGFATRINATGQVVGDMVNPFSGSPGTFAGFLWTGGSFSTDLNNRAPTINEFSGNDAYGINASGLIVGDSQSAGGSSNDVAVSWPPGAGSGTFLWSVTAYSVANAVNDNGVIVGSSSSGLFNPVFHAFIDIGGTVTDLNTLISPSSGWVLTSATGINNSDTIVGFGTFNGNTEAFELTVPEPATLGLLTIGALGLLARRRRSTKRS